VDEFGNTRWCVAKCMLYVFDEFRNIILVDTDDELPLLEISFDLTADQETQLGSISMSEKRIAYMHEPNEQNDQFIQNVVKWKTDVEKLRVGGLQLSNSQLLYLTNLIRYISRIEIALAVRLESVREYMDEMFEKKKKICLSSKLHHYYITPGANCSYDDMTCVLRIVYEYKNGKLAR
jgi:hypothetical protein